MRASKLQSLVVFGLTFVTRFSIADELADEVFDAIDGQDDGLKEINKEVKSPALFYMIIH
jgi:hypothetical protein